MSNRLDKEREKTLQPKRINFAIQELEKLGIKILLVCDTRIDFEYKGNKIEFYPYSGWHTGKGIKDGRGWEKLKKQLQQS